MSFTRPTAILEGDKADVFSCVNTNPNNILNTGDPDYVCAFFTSRNQKAAGDGDMEIKVKFGTDADIELIKTNNKDTDPSTLEGSDDASKNWTGADICTMEVIVNDSKPAISPNGNNCVEFTMTESDVTITSTGWTARLMHN